MIFSCCFFVLFCIIKYQSCELYLIKSKLPGVGKGIVAGKNYKRGTTVTSSFTLEIPYTIIESWSLENYVFGHEPGTCIIAFGEGMMFNHQQSAITSLNYYWSSSIKNYFDFNTKHSVLAGEELFISYGTDWFEARGFEYLDSVGESVDVYYTEEELETDGHCLTNAYISNIITHDGSSSNDENQLDDKIEEVGVFARRHFEINELVSLSLILLLPKQEMLEAVRIYPHVRSLLIRCIGHHDSDVLLLPLGRAALIRDSNKSLSNVRIAWNYTDSDLNLDLLWKLPYAPLELQYIATRRIEPDEELYLEVNEDEDEGVHGSLTVELIKKWMKIVPDNLYPLSWLYVNDSYTFTSSSSKNHNEL